MPQVPTFFLTMVEPANSQGLRGVDPLGIDYGLLFPPGITENYPVG